ncbi:hypothetical protein [Microlunatus sp. Gsoil 973]|uniref:DUF6918 family protein n=1 Tax=Microlunatus sp. Gsoil 973 TaxID=2672569 RepID=UPI0012B4A9FD|nr:hypothetical protein [Microlunatus sp. Gsoil 973]QGN32670.1 hypothetical protein GJV80_07460 [Microlunatus sp. Gsoil 973]
MSLSEKLLAEPVRTQVIADLVHVVDQEVGDKSGFSGTAVKAGYAAGRKVMPNLAERAVTRLLPDFAVAVDPYWEDFQAAGEGDFGQYLAGRGPEAAQSLLAVTDAKVATTSREALRRAYKPLRGKAVEHVRAALPRIGAVLQKHAG